MGVRAEGCILRMAGMEPKRPGLPPWSNRTPPNAGIVPSRHLDSFSSNAWTLQAPFLFLYWKPFKRRTICIDYFCRTSSASVYWGIHPCVKSSSVCSTSCKNHPRAKVQGIIIES